MISEEEPPLSLTGMTKVAPGVAPTRALNPLPPEITSI
jgi:hypothetical protein